MLWEVSKCECENCKSNCSVLFEDRYCIYIYDIQTKIEGCMHLGDKLKGYIWEIKFLDDAI